MKYVILDSMSETERGYENMNVQELIPADWITKAYICQVINGWEIAVEVRDPKDAEAAARNGRKRSLYRNTGCPEQKIFAEQKLIELQKELSE